MSNRDEQSEHDRLVPPVASAASVAIEDPDSTADECPAFAAPGATPTLTIDDPDASASGIPASAGPPPAPARSDDDPDATHRAVAAHLAWADAPVGEGMWTAAGGSIDVLPVGEGGARGGVSIRVARAEAPSTPPAGETVRVSTDPPSAAPSGAVQGQEQVEAVGVVELPDLLACMELLATRESDPNADGTVLAERGRTALTALERELYDRDGAGLGVSDCAALDAALASRQLGFGEILRIAPAMQLCAAIAAGLHEEDPAFAQREHATLARRDAQIVQVRLILSQAASAPGAPPDVRADIATRLAALKEAREALKPLVRTAPARPPAARTRPERPQGESAPRHPPERATHRARRTEPRGGGGSQAVLSPRVVQGLLGFLAVAGLFVLLQHGQREEDGGMEDRAGLVAEVLPVNRLLEGDSSYQGTVAPRWFELDPVQRERALLEASDLLPGNTALIILRDEQGSMQAMLTPRKGGGAIVTLY